MKTFFDHVLRPSYRAVRRFRSAIDDRQLGILTTDERIDALPEPATLPASRIPGGKHRAWPYTAIRRLLRRLAPGPSDVLVDFGCGAGRVVCVAAQYPFARVIGVEHDRRIFALAERNAGSLRRCVVRPEVVCANASTWRVPDETTIVFMYNPFEGDVLRAAMTRLLESYDRAPRRIRLLYANPREHDLLMSMGRFRETGRLLMSWRPGAAWARTQAVHFYEVEPDHR